MESLSQQTAARLAKPPRRKTRLFLQSLIGGFAHREAFQHLETFCTFIGYPRSGHTLIGSLIDAHPNALVADELNALRFIDAGFSRNQICYLMLRNSQKSAAAGRERTGYRYDVPGQWQGRHEPTFDECRKGGARDAAETLQSQTALPQGDMYCYMSC